MKVLRDSKGRFMKGHTVPDEWADQHAKAYMKDGKSRSSRTYKRWQEVVFKRDDYKCRDCGTKDKIIAHHILKDRTVRFAIGNGYTTCRKCHPLHHPELVYNLRK